MTSLTVLIGAAVVVAIATMIAASRVEKDFRATVISFGTMAFMTIAGFVTVSKQQTTETKVDAAISEQAKMAAKVDTAAVKADVAAAKAEEVVAVQVETKAATDAKLKTIVETTGATRSMVEKKLGPE